MSAQGRSRKGIIYTILSIVMCIAFICFISGIVFWAMGKAKNYSVWLFGLGSAELLPPFISASFILLAIPALIILACEVKKLRVLSYVGMAVSVCAVALILVITILNTPDNYYTVEVSDNGAYTIIICEANDGDINEVIFYQLLDNGMMRRLSTSRCICEGYRPISSGNAEIEWSGFNFTVKVPDPNTSGEFFRQTFTCIRG